MANADQHGMLVRQEVAHGISPERRWQQRSKSNRVLLRTHHSNLESRAKSAVRPAEHDARQFQIAVAITRRHHQDSMRKRPIFRTNRARRQTPSRREWLIGRVSRPP